jgi:hypothetical protein
MSRFPVAFRSAGISFLGILFPPRARLSLRSAHRIASTASGPGRGFHVSHARDTAGVGALCAPRPAVFTRPTRSPRSPLAVLPRPGPIPRFPSHHPRLTITRHQRGFNFVHPSGLPLARAPGWNRARLGFFPELRTPQLLAAHVKAGTGPRTLAGNYASDIASDLLSASSLATCDLVSQLLLRIDRDHR